MVSGVQSVVNDLQVVARAEQAAVQARDEELARAVQTAFATLHSRASRGRTERRGAADGTVPTGAQRLEAAVVARADLARTRRPGRPPPRDRPN